VPERLPRVRPRRSGARRAVWIGGWVALGLGVLTLVVTGGMLAAQVLAARSALVAAQSEIMTLKASIGRSGTPGTAVLSRRLEADAGRAVDASQGPVWSAYEGVPGLGPNLVAMRRVSSIVHTLAVQGVGPIGVAADGLSVDSLKPRDGRLDIAPLTALLPAVARLDGALRAADRSASAIDTRQLVPQLAKPLDSFRSVLRETEPVTAELRKVLPVLGPALGADGPRHYLLIFQNNAEERASGGNPAAMAMIDVDHGRITLGAQPNSGDFPHPYRVPPLTFQGDWARIFGPHTSGYVTNLTFDPDFPRSARMMRAMWRTQFGGAVDGVVSFDPVALSYLLRATGPIHLPNGEVLTSGNAVRYLLSDVYARYRVPAEQNAVFASAARAVFKAVTMGRGKPREYVKELTPMLKEQRLKAWSVRADEEDLLLTSPAGNMLPADDSEATTFGVYNNDDATSKMSYYMDERVDVAARSCPSAAAAYTLSTTITDTVDPSRIADLPPYVRPHQPHVPAGGDRQWVLLYGPVGAKLDSASIDGKRVVWGTDQDWHRNTVPDATGMDVLRPAVRGVLDGRPVGEVSVTVAAGTSVTVSAAFSGGSGTTRTIAVSHTPKVRPVPVMVTKASCG
jgi:hypothetical protein